MKLRLVFLSISFFLVNCGADWTTHSGESHYSNSESSTTSRTVTKPKPLPETLTLSGRFQNSDKGLRVANGASYTMVFQAQVKLIGNPNSGETPDLNAAKTRQFLSPNNIGAANFQLGIDTANSMMISMGCDGQDAAGVPTNCQDMVEEMLRNGLTLKFTDVPNLNRTHVYKTLGIRIDPN